MVGLSGNLRPNISVEKLLVLETSVACGVSGRFLRNTP